MQKPAEPNNVDLYTALAMFVSNAPRLIERIFNACETENLLLAEETAEKLNLYSCNARLTGFSKNINNVIIAARERNLPTVQSETKKLREIFDQMTKYANKMVLEKGTPPQENAVRISITSDTFS